jgi:hypothetical protein
MIAYSRQLVFAGEDSSVLALRLFVPQIAGEARTLEFPAVANDDSLAATSLADKLSFDLEVQASDEEAKLEVEVYAVDAKSLLQNGASTLDVGFELFNLATNRREKLVSVGRVALTDTTRLATTLSLPLSNLRGSQVRIRPVLSDLALGKVRGALMHEYGVDESRAPQGEAFASQVASSSYEFSVQAHPNPFNPSANIQFSLPEEGLVSLKIYNLQGQLVRELLHEQREAGVHTVTWDGKNDRGSISASGIYFLRIESGKQTKVIRMTLVR